MLKRVETTCDVGLAGFSCLFEILFFLFLFLFLLGCLARWDESLTKTTNERTNERKIKLIFDFCLLFFLRRCFLARCSPMKSQPESSSWASLDERKKFTTKTIMDPLIGFLDCVLVSFYLYFFKKIHFVSLTRESRVWLGNVRWFWPSDKLFFCFRSFWFCYFGSFS